MSFEDLLHQKRAAILDRWSTMIMETYPEQTAKFMKEQPNRFSNPVGHTIYQQAEALYGALLQEAKPDTMAELLDPLIRIRAVQDFSPGEAVGFVFSLKDAIARELDKELQDPSMPVERSQFESRIDALALAAFDLYMQCRERIYELRVDEVKRQTLVLLERAKRSAKGAQEASDA